MRRSRPTALVLGWLCLPVLVAGPAPITGEAWAEVADAGADSAPSEPAAAAEDLIKEGIEWRKRGDDRRALDAFERALTCADSAQAWAQLALAEQALGRWREADLHLELALGRGADPWISANRATLEQAREEIASRLGSLEITCNVAGAEIQLDGRVAGYTPLSGALRWVAGESIIRVSAPDYFDVTRQVKIDAGSLARVNVVLTSASDAALALQQPPQLASPPATTVVPRPAPAAAWPAPSGGERPGSTRAALTYASLGVAGLGLMLGATGYVIRENNASAYNDDARCLRPDVSRSVQCAGEARAVRRGEALAVAGFSAAGAFGLTALVLWLWRPQITAEARLTCSVGALSGACSAQF